MPRRKKTPAEIDNIMREEMAKIAASKFEERVVYIGGSMRMGGVVIAKDGVWTVKLSDGSVITRAAQNFEAK